MIVDFCRRARTFAFASLAALGLSASAQAATVLTIDVTDPSAVLITATGAASEQNAQIRAFRGFSLLNFFTGGTSVAGPRVATTLTTTAVTPVAINRVFTNRQTTYLNLYNSNSGVPAMRFDTSAPAFSGSTSIDLSRFSALFPAVGSSGRIALGDNLAGPFGAEIGDWEVVTTTSVPLPASLGLLLVGAGALGLMRRRG